MTRRRFVAASTALSYARILGANDRVRIGLLGCGGRGTYVSRQAKEFGNVEIAALADIYEPHIDRAGQQLNPAAPAHHDFRQLLDRPDIDAVIIGSPDHWHVPMT